MILKGDQLPGMPSNDRIMVLPDPVDEKAGVLYIPDIAKNRASYGTIIHAGLAARDQMYDNGHELGDHIWFGKFAGVWEEWDHIVADGKPGCEHAWSRGPSPGDRMEKYLCDCGAERLKEPALIMTAADILVNETLEQRVRDGAVFVVRAETNDGKTCHVIRRRDTNTISTLKESHAA